MLRFQHKDKTLAGTELLLPKLNSFWRICTCKQCFTRLLGIHVYKLQFIGIFSLRSRQLNYASLLKICSAYTATKYFTQANQVLAMFLFLYCSMVQHKCLEHASSSIPHGNTNLITNLKHLANSNFQDVNLPSLNEFCSVGQQQLLHPEGPRKLDQFLQNTP